jgi:hypothetical protein
VHIIIDHGQGGALSQGGQTLANSDCLTLGFTPTGTVSGCGSVVDFFTHKAANFSLDRLKIFHYAIFGKKGLDKTLVLVSGLGERFGNDFFVTLGTYPASEQQDPDVQLGHFLHELGHNLGFTHWDLMSDDQAIELKLNLPSVMNYVYTDGGVDVDCDTIPDGIYTYSQGTQAATGRIAHRRDDRHLRSRAPRHGCSTGFTDQGRWPVHGGAAGHHWQR